jgi:hypothetical protein
MVSTRFVVVALAASVAATSTVQGGNAIQLRGADKALHFKHVNSPSEHDMEAHQAMQAAIKGAVACIETGASDCVAQAKQAGLELQAEVVKEAYLEAEHQQKDKVAQKRLKKLSFKQVRNRVRAY